MWAHVSPDLSDAVHGDWDSCQIYTAPISKFALTKVHPVCSIVLIINLSTSFWVSKKHLSNIEVHIWWYEGGQNPGPNSPIFFHTCFHGSWVMFPWLLGDDRHTATYKKHYLGKCQMCLLEGCRSKALLKAHLFFIRDSPTWNLGVLSWVLTPWVGVLSCVGASALLWLWWPCGQGALLLHCRFVLVAPPRSSLKCLVAFSCPTPLHRPPLILLPQSLLAPRKCSLIQGAPPDFTTPHNLQRQSINDLTLTTNCHLGLGTFPTALRLPWIDGPLSAPSRTVGRRLGPASFLRALISIHIYHTLTYTWVGRIIVK